MAFLLKFFILGKIFFDTGTEYEAVREVIHPNYVYEGRLLEFGYIDKSIPVPSGLPQLGDCRIRLADTDRKFRELLAHQTPRRRFIEIRMVQEGTSEATHDPFGVFEIVDAEFPPGEIQINARDTTFAWIDKRIPGLINRTNFPTLMEGIDEGFMPIIQGIIESPIITSPPNPQGVLTLPRMTLRRWGLAQTPIVYVELVGKLPTDDEFGPINPADYTVTEEPHTIDGIDYTLSFIDFTVDQDPELIVRVSLAEGIYTRGAFGSMPAVQNSPITALRNPVDFLINMLYAILKTETRIPQFDVDSFAALRTKMETIIDASPLAPYACDGCVWESITVREFLAQFLTSFEIDMYVNRNGQIAISATTPEDPVGPVFSQGPIYGEPTDNSLVLINSVRQRLANPTCNFMRFNFQKNYATGEFWAHDIHQNIVDQAALGANLSPPQNILEEDEVDFLFVRDIPTAEDVVRRRLLYLALGAYRIEFNMPLPEVFNDLELAHLFRITSYWGLDLGGFHEREFKTTGLTYHLDKLLCTVRGIMRVPQEIGPQCPGITGPSVLDFGDAELFISAPSGQVLGAQVQYDPADYPGQTTVDFRATAVRSSAAADTAVSVVDENGTVYLTPTLTYVLVPSTGNYEANIDVPITLDPDEAHTYRLKLSKNGAAGVFQVLVPRLWIGLEGSDQAKFQIPMMPGNMFDLAGSYLRTSTSYGVMTATAFDPAVWKKEEGEGGFGQVDYYEIYVLADYRTGSGNIALFNKTTDLMVTGTEFTIAVGNGVSPTLHTVRIGSNATNFTNGDDFEFRAKYNSTPGPTGLARIQIAKANVYVKIGSGEEDFFTEANLCAEHAQNYLRANVSNCQDILMNRAFEYFAADWPESAISYFEATGDATSTGSATWYLLDTGTRATPTSPPTNVISVTFPVGPTSRQRSIAFSLTDLHVYSVGNSADPIFDIPGYVLFTISGA